MAARVKAGFVEPMLLLRTDVLPDERARWEYELKFDGYRAVAFKSGGRVYLRSRNNNDFSVRFPAIVRGVAKLPDETAIDGEVVALDEDGRPSFNALQNYSSPNTPIVYYVFDVMVLAGRDLKMETLAARRGLRSRCATPARSMPICATSSTP
jgi:bifunctional non-homologous end joining protein LigD